MENFKNKFKIVIIVYIAFMLIIVTFNRVRRYISYRMNPPVVVNTRVYDGTYKGRIEEKYPQAMKNVEIAREELLKTIKTKNIYKRDSDHLIGEYYDKKGRLIFHSNQSLGYTRMASQRFERFMPTEEGTLYDEKDRVYKRIRLNNGLTYFAKSTSENDLYSFIKDITYNCEVEEIKYLEKDKKIEHSTEISTSSQYYKEIIKEYKNNILVSEKMVEDEECDDGFIIATIEKKYNEKGELVYKTVERKDKTNDYRSFTEMNFAKDEIVTKYYKGKDVFATVTENLIGSVETIEGLEMIKGDSIKVKRKNKAKAIVKRQKVGEPIKIIDVLEYYDREKSKKDYGTDYCVMINTRYIFDESGKLKFKINVVRDIIDSYLYYNLNFTDKSFDMLYLNNSFYSFAKKNELSQFSTGKLKIEGFNDNKSYSYEVNKKKLKETYNKIISGRISEDDLRKKTKIAENIKIKTLEELLNEYRHE